MKIALTLPAGVQAVNGKQISFVAPCSSLDAECMVLNGTEYAFVDAAAETIAGSVYAWEKGAVVSIILDTIESKAYVQNANTNVYLEGKFRELQKLLYMITVPTQSGALTYTGQAQSPVWNDYNPDMMEMSGDTSGTAVGTYTTTFTLKSDEYMWADNTSEPKSITWTISPTIITTVPSQSGTLTYTGDSQSPSWNNYDSSKMTMGGVTSGTDAGSYNATFTPGANYQWSDGTTEAKTVAWSIGRASMSVPAQSGTLTYSGSAQTPSWSNYDSSKMTIGGTTSGTNAGTYNATFTPTSNYKWSDGSTSAKTVSWSIGKAAGSLTLNKSSMSLKVGALTGTIAVSRAGDGAITATSSNTGVATVSVSGTTITVTAKAKGDATITVKVAAGTNHTAPADKTCAVSVTLPTSTLNDNSWETIREVSDAGQAANYWAVGATKAITINGKVGATTISNLSLNVFIIGIDHNSSKEGTNRIHFQIGKSGTTDVCLCDGNYGSNTTTSGAFTMNTSNTNSGGWSSSHMRKTVLGSNSTPSSPTANTLLAALPADLLNVLKSVSKYTDNTGNSSNTSGAVTATTDYLFLLAEFEVQGARRYANQYEQNSQAQYDYYKAGNSKVKYKHNATTTAAYWWCRSALYNGSTGFCRVYTNGSANGSNADYSYGLAPGFCV